MNIYALELNNEIKGISLRKQYIEQLISKTDQPDIIVLPELALCSYMGSTEIWQYADNDSLDTSQWAMQMAEKYNTYIAVGYLEKTENEYYNSYLIADKNKVYGIVRKSEGESYIFKRGNFPNVISTPLGNITVAICYDSRRKHFYENIKNNAIALILFPHGAPSNPRKAQLEQRTIHNLCNIYFDAFNVPVVYVNSRGKLDFMLGRTGAMMKKAGFVLNGMSIIYCKYGEKLSVNASELIGWSGIIKPQTLRKQISFYGNDIIKGNWLFRKFVLKPDVRDGICYYEAMKNKEI